MRRLVPFAVAFAVATIAPSAHPQAQGDAKKEAKERKEERKEEKAAEKNDDGGKAPGRDKKDAAATDAGAVADALPRPPPRPRADRRRSEVAKTRARWGAVVVSAAARAELRVHALRMAKIDAMERVARDSGKVTLLGRIERLREKEEARHDKRMDQIREEKDGG